MYWLQLVVIVALLAAVGWLAIGGGGHMSEPMPDRPDLALPNDGMLERTDVDRVRFSVGARGYRMDEVDDVLDRLAHEIEAREQRIAELEGRAPRPGASPDAEGEGSDSESGSDETESETGSVTVSETELTPESESAAEPASVSETENVSAESKAEARDVAAAPVQSTPENEGTAE
jgi:DivIVA domain-containing protein